MLLFSAPLSDRSKIVAMMVSHFRLKPACSHRVVARGIADDAPSWECFGDRSASPTRLRPAEFLDPDQGREAPAREASGRPRFGAMRRCPRLPLSKKEYADVASNSHSFGSRSPAAGHLHSRRRRCSRSRRWRLSGRWWRLPRRRCRSSRGSGRRCRSAWRALRLSGWAPYRGYGVGAAAVGAAAVGAAAAGAYRGSCYDAYGNYICAGGYRPY